MGTQQSSRSQARLKQASEKQTNTELDFIFKRPIFGARLTLRNPPG